MRLTEIKEMLQAASIPFQERIFESESDFLAQILSDPYTKNTKTEKICALMIQSENGKKNIELEFCERDGDFVFWDLWFGEICFECFIYCTDASDLLDTIRQIMMGNLGAITENNAKTKRWYSDAIFDLSDEDDGEYGKLGFEKKVNKIRKKKSFIERLFGVSFAYEIYTWDTYEYVVK